MMAFISDTSRRADKMSLALNQSKEPYLVSSISTVIQTDNNRLLSKYLYLFFCICFILSCSLQSPKSVILKSKAKYNFCMGEISKDLSSEYELINKINDKLYDDNSKEKSLESIRRICNKEDLNNKAKIERRKRININNE